MRGPCKWYRIVTHLVIDDCVSDITHKFRNGLNTFIVSCIVRSLDAVRYHLKLIPNTIEGTIKKSVGLNNGRSEKPT